MSPHHDDNGLEPVICLRCDGAGKTHGIGGGVTRCPCCGGRGVEYVERKAACEENTP
jgi:hypothetical protein